MTDAVYGIERLRVADKGGVDARNLILRRGVYEIERAHDVWQVNHYYGVYVHVPARARCPHGEGTTTADPHGVRIACPKEHDCWVVKWEWDD
jgi:hypothetical protein